MEKDRNSRIIAIAALVIAVVGLSLGFAAFSSTLSISASATVAPDNSGAAGEGGEEGGEDDNIVFDVRFTTESGGTGSVAGTPSGETGATAGSAVLGNTSISGLSATFTKPGQTVTYKFKAKNVGQILAYLNEITYSGQQTCAPKQGDNPANASTVTRACNHIKLKVKVGSTEATDTKDDIIGHSLATGVSEDVTVTIEYESDNNALADQADGDFEVTFPTITLNYSAVDLNNED